MSEQTGRAALVGALSDWRRNLGAVAAALAVLGVAAAVGTKIAYYTAALIVFSIWMAWFVLACIEWIKLADF